MMPDRYDGPYHADADDTPQAGGRVGPGGKIHGDPLAELARLIGQTDPNSKFGRANIPAAPGARVQPSQYRDDRYAAQPYDDRDDEHVSTPPGPPSWMQHQRAPADDFGHDDSDLHAAVHDDPHSTPHPLRRYAAAEGEHDAGGAAQPHYADDRYDDALYGPADAGYAAPDYGHYDAPQADDDGSDADVAPPRGRKGLLTVAAVMALAVVGTGGAFAYRTYVSGHRLGEVPVIKADNTPIKVVPPSAGEAAKPMQDRMAAGGAEQLVSREETPVDVRDPTKAGPRVSFPPLQANPVVPAAAPTGGIQPPKPSAPGDEPRRVRTVPVKGDPADLAATPAARPIKQPVAAPRPTAANSNASANAPMSLSPQTTATTPSPASGRLAANDPTTAAPATGGAGGYVVQVASQRSEADARASYQALQGKYGSVIGARQPVIKRADLGEKGVYYRALIGPFGSADEATTMCANLKVAGGQCVVQRN